MNAASLPTDGASARGAGLARLSLFINYAVFGCLLNSVGTVILQVQRNFGASPSSASVLEACKDISIAAASFFVATQLPRIGLKRGMLWALGLMILVCEGVALSPSFLATKLLFVATGLSFGVIKVGAFSAIGLLAKDEKAHASLMSYMESVFMLGILGAYFLFGAFIGEDPAPSTRWFRVYHVLAAAAFVAWVLLRLAPLQEPKRREEDARPTRALGEMARLAFSPQAALFAACVFLYVLAEQGIMSWLPTYNNQVLRLPASLSVQMASILAVSTALGRFVAGWTLRRVAWPWVLGTSIVAAITLTLLALPLARHAAGLSPSSWFDAPLAAYLFPCIGFFLAPIYPTINSLVLSRLPSSQQASMAGVIVLFSALGGTSGSFITGRVFQSFGGQTAFSLVLIPLIALGCCLWFFWRRRSAGASDT